MRVRAHAVNHPRYHRGADAETDDRRTDAGLWLELHSRWRFTVDAAAAPHNAMLPRYWTRETDGLTQSWRGERVWVNPPYSRTRPWVEKAWAEHRAGCQLAAILLPANCMEQRTWQELVEPFRDRRGSGLRTFFLPGRPRFTGADGSSLGRPPFSLVLCVWSRRWAARRPTGESA